ncbi:hypothetical protein BGZ59_010607, partial [Podila verticillata]
AWASKPPHTLKSLRVYSSFKGSEELIFLPFLTTCGSNLKEIGVPKLERFYTPNIYEVLTQRAICLEEISSDLHTGLDTSDAVLAENIVHSPRLKRIDIQCCYNAAPLTAAAIQSHFESLEELNLSHCSGITSTHLLAILQQLRRLRVLVTMMEPGNAYPETPFLSATEMLEATEEWGSTSLVKFVCMIRVPRTNDDVVSLRREEAWVSPTVKHSHNVKRQVYRLLARQTKLEALILGHWSKSGKYEGFRPFYQDYSLEMSLDSGLLDELAVLKEIKELDVRLVNHKIGVRELEWMIEHWPRLRVVKGLIQDKKRHDENTKMLQAWLDVNRPTWALE